VPDLKSFDYAVIRVVPRVDREEFVNSGVILFCQGARFLGARTYVDAARLTALWPELDVVFIRARLEAYQKISAGSADGGPVAKLSQRERFHWMVAPRSTTIQVAPVHSGLCEEPEPEMNRLFQLLVPVPHRAT
jgi:Protein of unknown function (DUF3037)